MQPSDTQTGVRRRAQRFGMCGRSCIVAGAAMVAFGGILGVLDTWGWRLQGVYAYVIGYDGCRCEQCLDYYLGGFWYEKYGCNGPRHDRLWAGAWSAAAGSGLIAAPWGALALCRRRRLGRGLCPNCGYDQRGLPTMVCPECGARSSRSSGATGG